MVVKRNYCNSNFNVTFNGKFVTQKLSFPWTMDRPWCSHLFATGISRPNSVGFLFVGLDEERSLRSKGGYTRRIAGSHFGCCCLPKETRRSTRTNSTRFSHTSCKSALSRTVRFSDIYSELCGSGSVVRIATGYGLDGPGIESRWGEIFHTCPDRP